MTIHPSALQLALALLATLGTGGVFGAWLVHRRLVPISDEKAAGMNWDRFQKEIGRMETKMAAQSERIDCLEREVRDLRREKTDLEIENIKLKAAEEIRGEVRQEAAKVVAIERKSG